MRDRRDFVIAALAAALIFTAGLLVGGSGSVLPEAAAQDGNSASGTANSGNGPGGNGPGITIGNDPLAVLRNRVTTTGPTASDSNSNNRFVAVTTPIGSGESALFLIDAETEQLAVYRFLRNKGLAFMAARKIDYDLKINEWNDRSQYTRDEMKRLYHKHRAQVAAEAAKSKKSG